MTRFTRWLRNLKERAVGTFYEGPEPPHRLREIAIDFANRHPRATRAEWLEFAIAHAEESYRGGYVRGAEWVERDENFRMPPSPSPEELADALDPDWRWSPAISLEGDPDAVVQQAPELEEARLKRIIEEVNRGRKI